MHPGELVSMCSREDVGMKKPANRNSSHEPFDLELDDLLNPARAFAHPCDVVNDPDLSLNEKRAILASWASDACAVEAAPALRWLIPLTQVALDVVCREVGRVRSPG